jgi:hypothetical protein
MINERELTKHKILILDKTQKYSDNGTDTKQDNIAVLNKARYRNKRHYS